MENVIEGKGICQNNIDKKPLKANALRIDIMRTNNKRLDMQDRLKLSWLDVHGVRNERESAFVLIIGQE